MCNLYNAKMGGDQSQAETSRQVANWVKRDLLLRRHMREKDPLYCYNIRPTIQAPVVLGDEIVEMRWGIPHEKFKSVTNARGDNLRRVKPWRDALDAGRRCLAPVGSFYEYSGLTKAKVANAFLAADGRRLWVPGLWEERPDLGLCFTMITTDPGPDVAALHDRQIACLSDDESDSWLAGDIDAGFFRDPRSVPLVTFPARNPLLKSTPPGPPVHLDEPPAVQLELFA